ncbi:MAG: cupin domain-containing protein [Actinobacteria bacterium]|nr:cupin domain-containing protein [Actinomycetota bacterium]
MGRALALTPIQSVTVIRSEPELLEVETEYAADGSPPPKHLHPAQDERFEVLAGTLRVVVDGEERDLATGEEIEIPRGSAHQMWNPGGEIARVRWQTLPAGRTEDFFAALDRLNREQRLQEFPAVVEEFDDTFVLVWD